MLVIIKLTLKGSEDVNQNERKNAIRVNIKCSCVIKICIENQLLTITIDVSIPNLDLQYNFTEILLASGD